MYLLSIANLFILQAHYYYHRDEPKSIFDGWLGDLITWVAFLAFIGFFVWLGIRTIMRMVKKNAVQKFLQDFSKIDSFWNEKKMKQVAEVIYNQSIMSWSKKTTFYVSEYTSDELQNLWKQKWVELADKGYGFHCTSAEIDSITIVNAEDSSYDEKDSFTAEIAAYTIRYVYDLETRQAIDGHYNGKNLVYDHFIFTRKNNKWVLTEVDFYTQLNDSIKLRSKQEKPGKPEDK